MKAIEEQHENTVLLVVAFSFPHRELVMLVRNDFAEMQYPKNLNARSQDLEPIYHDTGQFYAFNISTLLKEEKTIGQRALPFIRSNLEM